MRLEGITGAVLRPAETVQALLKDKANRQDRSPGTRALFLYQAALCAVLGVLAWASFAALLLLFKALHWRPDWMWSVSRGLWLEALSPWALLWSFIKGAALLMFTAWGVCELQDRLFQRLFGHGGGQQVLVFNAVLLASLPWALFALVPVIGWLVALVGSVWAAYLVVSRAYGEKDPFKVVAAGLLAGLPVALAAWVLALGLTFAGRPILALDPLQPSLDRLLALGDEPRQDPWAALGSMGAGAQTQAMRDAAQGQAALQLIQAAVAQGPKPAAAPATAARQQRLVARQPAQRRSPVPAAVIPGSKATVATAAPAVTEPSASAAKAAEPSAAGQAAASAGGDIPAAAASDPASPSTEAATGPSAGQAVGKAVASEAARQGVDSAVKLLRLFH